MSSLGLQIFWRLRLLITKARGNGGAGAPYALVPMLAETQRVMLLWQLITPAGQMSDRLLDGVS